MKAFAMTLAAVQFGILGRLRAEGASASLAKAFAEAGSANASEAQSRQIEALGRTTDWLNTPPLSSATLRGKVVLVQFGTYTCINWLRTLPYIRAWDQATGSNRRSHLRYRVPRSRRGGVRIHIRLMLTSLRVFLARSPGRGRWINAFAPKARSPRRSWGPQM